MAETRVGSAHGAPGLALCMRESVSLIGFCNRCNNIYSCHQSIKSNQVHSNTLPLHFSFPREVVKKKGGTLFPEEKNRGPGTHC